MDDVKFKNSFSWMLQQKGSIAIDRRHYKIGIFTLTSRVINILAYVHLAEHRAHFTIIKWIVYLKIIVKIVTH